MMSSIHLERETLSKKINEEIIPSCCNGNRDAEAYLKRVFFVVRMLDDIYDEDVEVEKSDILKGFFLWLADIASNRFYKEYQEMLTAIHIVSFNAWQDANEWEKTDDELKKLYAHVTRDYICELFILTAYLTGGSKLMRKVSLEVRTLFLKEIGT